MSGSREEIGSPSSVTVPSSGVVTPASAFVSVVLPQPLRPMIATSSPERTVRDAPETMSLPARAILTLSARRHTSRRPSRPTSPSSSRNTRSVPTRTESPTCSRARSTRRPPTQVPLRDPRSSIQNPSASRSIRRWNRETFGSSTGTSLLRSRPTHSGASPTASRQAPAEVARSTAGSSTSVSSSPRRRSTSLPICTRSPGATSRTSPRSGSPFTRVPLADPQSSITKRPSSRRSTACRRDAVSSVISTSFPSPRPIVSPLAGTGRRSLPRRTRRSSPARDPIRRYLPPRAVLSRSG